MTAVDTTDRAVAETPRPLGAWRAAVRGWRVFVPLVVVHAVVQALTVVADPVPALTVGFAALVLGSAAALVVTVWIVVGTAAAVVDHRPWEAWRTVRSRPVVALWVVVVGVVAVAASLLAGWSPPAVLVVGAFLWSAAGAGRPAFTGAFTTVRRRPVRAALLVVVALVVAALSAVVALLLGLFVTGWLSAGLLWLWLGAAGTVLQCGYGSLVQRAASVSR